MNSTPVAQIPLEVGAQAGDTRLPEWGVMGRIWSELQRLNVPMKGWWAEPVCEVTGEPSYGMEVAPEALHDYDAGSWLIFAWDPVHGWTMDGGCEPQVHTDGITVLDIPGDPFDVPAVAEYLRRVVVGEIDEFRTVKP